MKLYSYQQNLVQTVFSKWQAGARAVCMQLPTGGGKTICLSNIIQTEAVRTLVIAHRHEIVSQLSLALARNGLTHDVIASTAARRLIAEAHAVALDRMWLSPTSDVRVASVQTLVRQLDKPSIANWLRGVKLWVVDEAHHLVRDTAWGKVIDALPAGARGLGPTATPYRLDGKGLGAHNDGFMDAMVEGPPVRWLIDNDYLSDYDIACVDSHLQDYLGEVAKSGDWSQAKLSNASRQSQIVGDVCHSYYQFAFGRRGLTFATDVETAQRMAEEYTAVGVEADVLTGDTPPQVRARRIRRLERGGLKQLVAVDVVSEGFDLPAVDVVTLARPTKSLNLYLQQVGRGLRAAPGKDKLMLIDHVGNVLDPGLGLPDRPRQWSLERRSDREKRPSDGIPLRVCFECAAPYEAFRQACPHCGAPKPAPAARSRPEHVDGVLSLLDPETLAQMRGDMERAHMPVDEYRAWIGQQRMPGYVVDRNVRIQGERLDALDDLRAAINWWGAQQGELPKDDLEAKFYLTFGTTVLEALSLNLAGAKELRDRITG